MNEDSDMSEQNEIRSTLERKILGELGNSNPDSPTANLRLLTTLASNLKNVTNNPCQMCSSSNNTVEVPPGKESGCMKLLPRKEKSLSLLCNKFLNLFPLTIQDNIPKKISLNTTAQVLGTEKRRIYDIINVLESLEMASKAGKNQYFWHGQSRLSMTLTNLKMSAIEMGLEKQIQEIQKINRAYLERSCRCCNSYSSALMVPQSPIVDYCFPDTSIKEDKSLGVMCRKFVMLFLVSLKNGVINLDIAAKVLISEQNNSSNTKNRTIQSRYKTKVRRLYDIANVLSAIGLIEKVDLYNCIIRKPIFRYTGPSIDCINFDAEMKSTVSERQSLVGMTTPNKKSSSTFNYHPLNRFTRLCLTTPIGNKSESRKRKLFDSDNKFDRTQNSSNLSKLETRSLDRLDDSILKVAEMELKRMKSSEHKSKVCTKLFPRHNSDSCISPLRKKLNLINTKMENMASTSKELVKSTVESSIVALPVVSKENLVNESCKFVTPIRTVRINNKPLELKIAPIRLQQCNTPKFVKLTNFDMKKLVPISKEDIEIKLSSVNSMTQMQKIHKPNMAIVTHIPTKKISSGDIFKAIKVGNLFQLIPIENKSDNQNK